MTGTHRDSRLAAVNVLLKPDAAARRLAATLNAALRSDLPTGFAFDETHEPHITLLQLLVSARRLDEVAALVGGLVVPGRVPKLRATGLSSGELGTPPGTRLVSIDMESVDSVREIQAAALETLAPFRERGGTPDAFFRLAGEPPVNEATVTYVEHFPTARTGERYSPHMTVGVGRCGRISTLSDGLFQPHVVQPRTLALYLLGDLGTARREIRSWVLA